MHPHANVETRENRNTAYTGFLTEKLASTCLAKWCLWRIQLGKYPERYKVSGLRRSVKLQIVCAMGNPSLFTTTGRWEMYTVKGVGDCRCTNSPFSVIAWKREWWKWWRGLTKATHSLSDPAKQRTVPQKPVALNREIYNTPHHPSPNIVPQSREPVLVQQCSEDDGASSCNRPHPADSQDERKRESLTEICSAAPPPTHPSRPWQGGANQMTGSFCTIWCSILMNRT